MEKIYRLATCLLCCVALGATLSPAYATVMGAHTVETHPEQLPVRGATVNAAPVELSGLVIPEMVTTGSTSSRRGRGFLSRVGRFLAPGYKSGSGAGFAVAGLVCGIAGLFFSGIILGTLAIVFGAIALKRAKAGLHGRKNMSIAALVLGIVAVVGGILFTSILINNDNG